MTEQTSMAEQRRQQCLDEMSRLNVDLHEERTMSLRERISMEKDNCLGKLEPVN